MKKYILKRDGRRKQFDKQKIVNAIKMAFESTQGEEFDEYAETKANNIADYIEQKVDESENMMSVEDIQDLVENGLMSCKKKNVAKQYILYRAQRNRLRSQRSEFNKIIGEKLTASNVQNNNANMDEYSFGGRMGEAGNELAKKYALENIISKKFADLHNNNICYIHDLNSVAIGSHNCITIPLDDLLKNGFDTRQQTIREATTVSSALQLVAVIMQCQSLVQFGGVSASHLDWTLVPYVRKSFSKHMKDGLRYVEKISDESYIDSIPKELPFDNEYAKTHEESYKYAMDMTKREVYQAVEGLLHNLNSLQSRSGNQLPFSSINYGTCTLEEGRLVTRAILENTIKGGGKLHSTYIFPCQIFKMKRGVNRKEGDPNYDLYKLALKCTARRLYPNYANVDWSANQFGNDGSIDAEMSTMGKCKLAHVKSF